MRTIRAGTRSRPLLVALVATLAMSIGGSSLADQVSTIERVRGSVVAIGTYARMRTPPFQFLGTGFAVEDGTYIVTNAHVVPTLLDPAKMESLVIVVAAQISDGKDQVTAREAKQVMVDPGSDLAILSIGSPGLPALKIRGSAGVKEGQEVLFTGYPIGSVLGPFPATHRGMISAITPIAIPQGRAGELDPHTIRRLALGAFAVFQLDATAYPGNSGSPVYDPVTGDVLAVINMVFVKSTKEAVMSQPSGITYAIPSNRIEELLKKLH